MASGWMSVAVVLAAAAVAMAGGGVTTTVYTTTHEPDPASEPWNGTVYWDVSALCEIDTVPKEARCAYVTTTKDCLPDSRVHYLQFAYCSLDDAIPFVYDPLSVSFSARTATLNACIVHVLCVLVCAQLMDEPPPLRLSMGLSGTDHKNRDRLCCTVVHATYLVPLVPCCFSQATRLLVFGRGRIRAIVALLVRDCRIFACASFLSQRVTATAATTAGTSYSFFGCVFCF